MYQRINYRQIGNPVAVAILAAYVLFSASFAGCSGSGKPDSEFAGVQIGVITYSWRSMPGSAEDIIRYCKQTGISSIELMGNVAEAFAGAPEPPERPDNFGEMSDEQRAAFMQERRGHAERLSEWRIQADTDERYGELRKMFDRAGIRIHIVKFSPAGWSDEEIDYAFESARILGADGVSNEIGHEACRKLGTFAEKHDMYAIFHNHGQPGDPGFDFEEFLAYSPRNMLNFDVGHFFGATGTHPNELITKLHDRIYSLHLKDKTAIDANPPDTNMPWGEGDTPLEDILTLIRDKGWDIKCDIELEYPVPEDSDAVQETAKLVDYCREILAGPKA